MKLGAWSTRVGLGWIAVLILLVSSIAGCGSSGGGESGSTGATRQKLPIQSNGPICSLRQANSQIKSKDFSGAARNLSLANKAVDEIRDPARQAEILAKIGAAYNRAGQKGERRQGRRARRRRRQKNPRRE